MELVSSVKQARDEHLINLFRIGGGLCVKGHSHDEHMATCKRCWVKRRKRPASEWQSPRSCEIRRVDLELEDALLGDKEACESLPELELWAARAAYLKHLARAKRDFCQLAQCYYDVYVEKLRRDWRMLDMQIPLAEWEHEQRCMHYLGEPYHFKPSMVVWNRGENGTIPREIFYGNQPDYTILGIGMSGISRTPFAKVRRTNTHEMVMVDLGDALRKLSANQRHKCIRYAKALPKDVQAEVDSIVAKAMKTL